ncbi:MAG: TetR/AcrR family transcriptional regulator [Ottowia sp.]|nr:TetR/AcrR family transcriptional regulator [Ottowia sp.]
MGRKQPRRTAERILATSLALFNRFGEPNTSTSMISAELNISPGNLYYHFPSKDELINTLFEHYKQALTSLLAASEDVHDVEDAWFFLHSLFELIWQYRFFYRDLNHLLSRNRLLETSLPALLRHKQGALQVILQQLGAGSNPGTEPGTCARGTPGATAASMVVVLTYWLSYEYVLQPRSALEPENEQNALLRGAWHVMGMMVPYLQGAPRRHLVSLLQAYQDAASAAP